MLTLEQIRCCRTIGRNEAENNSVIGLPELDALCDTAEMAQRWISVKDRMPKLPTRVLVSSLIFRKYRRCSIGSFCYEDGGWCLDDGEGVLRDGAITHWQPLPEPPK